MALEEAKELAAQGARRLQRGDFFQGLVDIEAPAPETGPHLFDVIAYECRIEHATSAVHSIFAW